MAQRNIGLSLIKLKKFPEAEIALKEAIGHQMHAGAYFNLCHALFHQDKFKEAESAIREAIKLDDSNARYKRELGVILHKQ